MHVDYKKMFPVNPVQLRWQDLKLLTHVEEEWLMNCAYHHNPVMTSINSPFALYAITKVDLSDNNLGRSVPKIFFKLPSLHSLNLSKNKLEHFPSENSFSLSCDCLEEFRVDNNILEKLPTYLFSLPKLKMLSASSNFLTDIPAEIWSSPSLIILNLADNKLSELPLPKRSSNPQDGHLIPSVIRPSSVSSNQSLFDFDMSLVGTPDTKVRHASYWCSHLDVKETDFDLANHQDAYKRGLQDLDLSKNQLTDIPYWLCCCAPFMENLNLSENRINNVRSISIYPQHLKTLDLSMNRFANIQVWQSTAEDIGQCYSNRG